jgi:hypothetical protein
LIILISNIFAISRVKKAMNAGLRAKTVATSKYSRGEEGSNMAFNGGSWTGDVKIYLKEVDGPSSWPDVRGIVFSSNFGRTNFVKYHYNTPNWNLDVYYLPYRNLNSITCNASGSNRAVTSDGTTTYDIWLNVWESECNTIANYMDSNRRSRQSTLAKTAKDLSSYANDYVTNVNTYEGLVAGSTTLSGQLKTTQTSLASTNADIATNTKSSQDTAAQINTEQVVLSGMLGQSSKLQTLIDTNNDQISQIMTSVAALGAKGGIAASQKATFTTAASAALTNFNTLLALLTAENILPDPTSVAPLAGASDKLKALDMESVKAAVNGVLPN